MKKFISVTLASLLVATSALSSVASAAPRHQDRERFVSNYCSHHPRDRDCRDWSRNRGHWDDSRYNRWYRSHRHERGFDAGDAAAALFGFAAGAIAAGAATAAGGGHVAACEARYRSYDRASDTYLGLDGVRHRCNL